MTSLPLLFPPSADLVDAAINPHVRLTVPPATPPGEYQIELVGRGKDGRALAATMQLTVNAVVLPKASTGRNPVVLLNGFQLVCTNSSSTLTASQDTFGQLASLLGGDGAPVVFFNNCSYGDISIEQLAASWAVI